jgi:hypothetical protein
LFARLAQRDFQNEFSQHSTLEPDGFIVDLEDVKGFGNDDVSQEEKLATGKMKALILVMWRKVSADRNHTHRTTPNKM